MSRAGHSQSLEALTAHRPSRPRIPAIRAMLWGGSDGCTPVFVDELSPEIRVYRNGGAAFAASESSPLPPATSFLGRYRLVQPLGPDTPVYIAAD